MVLVVVLALEMVALNKSHDAIVHDVEDARFVEHFQHVFVFRTGWNHSNGMPSCPWRTMSFPDGLFGSFRRKEKHHDFGLEALLDGGANGAAEDGPASIPRMNREPTANPSRPDREWLDALASRGSIRLPKRGWSSPCGPYLQWLDASRSMVIFCWFSFSIDCSSPQNSSIKATQV